MGEVVFDKDNSPFISEKQKECQAFQRRVRNHEFMENQPGERKHPY